MTPAEFKALKPGAVVKSRGLTGILIKHGERRVLMMLYAHDPRRYPEFRKGRCHYFNYFDFNFERFSVLHE